MRSELAQFKTGSCLAYYKALHVFSILDMVETTWPPLRGGAFFRFAASMH